MSDEVTQTPAEQTQNTQQQPAGAEQQYNKPHYTEQQPVHQQPQNVRQKQHPTGWQQIDFNKPLEQQKQVIQDRLNYMYKQIKDNERTWGEAQNYVQGLESQIKELKTRADTYDSDAISAELDNMQARATQLLSSEDPKDIAEGTKLIRELAQKEAEYAANAEQKEQPEQNVDQNETIKQTVDYLQSPQVSNYLVQWASQRTWTQNPVLKQLAIRDLANRVSSTPNNVPLDQLLAQTEQAIGQYVNQVRGQQKPQPTQQQVAQQVLGGNAQARPRTTGPAPLTAAEEKAATNLFPRLSREEAIKRYQKGKKGSD